MILVALTTGLATAAYYRFSHARLDTAALPRPWLNAPYVRTPAEIVDKLLELAAPGENDLLYDLGCGDGRIVIRAAEKYACRAVGFDIDPQRVEEARENARRHGLANRVTIVEQDILTLDLAEANVVTLYLLPRLNQKLLPQLQKLKPGSRVISHDFDLPGVVPDRVVLLNSSTGQAEHVLYLWTAPLRVAE